MKLAGIGDPADTMVTMTEVAGGRRANKRGLATRENMITAAITSLATGDPAAVSGNRIARDIGVTWGAIKYQFGDIDGLWAAVLRHTAELRGDLPANAPRAARCVNGSPASSTSCWLGCGPPSRWRSRRCAPRSPANSTNSNANFR